MTQSSSILKLIYVVCIAVYGSIQESRIVNWFDKRFNTINIWFQNCKALKVLQLMGEGLVKVNSLFYETLFYRVSINLIEMPIRFLRFIYRKIKQSFEASLFFKLMIFFLDRLYVLIGLTLLVYTVVPFDYWNNLYALGLNLCLFALLIIKNVVYQDKKISVHAYNLYGFVFILAVIISFAMSINPLRSLRFFVFYVNAFFMLVVISSEIDSMKKFKCVINIFMLGVMFTGLYGIRQWMVGIPVSASTMDTSIASNLVGRVYSTIGNANNYAELLVLSLPFIAAAFLNSKTVAGKLYYMMIAAPVIVALLLTYSRSSWLGLAFAVFVFLLFWNWKLIPVLGLAAVAAFPFLPATISGRIITIFTGDSSTSMRTIIWSQVTPMIKDYWITGIGLGQDIYIQVMENYPTEKDVVHAHSIYLEILIEMGIFGLISFVALQFKLLLDSIKAAKNSLNQEANNYIYAAIAAIFGFLLIGIVEYVWHEHRIMLFFFMTMGYLSALLRNVKEA